MNPDKARSDGFLLICLGALTFVALGFLMLMSRKDQGLDFRVMYSAASSLMEGADPYNPADLERIYHEHAGSLAAADSSEVLKAEAHYVYFPTLFIVTVPIAILPMKVAFWLWTALTAASFIFAALLIWRTSGDSAPLLTGGLLCFYLINSGSLMATGNPAGMALSLCVAGTCAILGESVVLGVICLAFSLAMKPQVSGPVWLILILLSGAARRRALQTLGFFMAATLPFFLWTQHTSPHWLIEMRSNAAALLGPGGSYDLNPATVLSRGTLSFTNLQSVFALIRNDRLFYNAAAYAVGLVLLGIFIFVSTRVRCSGDANWIAVAFGAAFTLLSVYHRQYDARILLLTIPGCVTLWAGGGRVGKMALAITSLGLLMTSDLPWAFYIAATSKLQLTGLAAQLYFYSLALTVPLVVTLVAVFYLTIWVKKAERAVSPEAS